MIHCVIPHLLNNALESYIFLKAKWGFPAGWTPIGRKMLDMFLAKNLMTVKTMDAIVAYTKTYSAFKKFFVHVGIDGYRFANMLLWIYHEKE